MQQLIYTNVSNIYTESIATANDLSQDLLLTWLNYAEKNGINPEDAFYHVAVATPYSRGSDHSTAPVDEFWDVFNTSGQDVYSEAYSGGTNISLGGTANQAVEIGYLDPFWEINFVLNSAPSGGWTYALEYPTAVDSSGNPTSWGTFTLVNDTTDGLTQSGQITFNAPSNWVPASIDGSALMYYVRIRTVDAGTAPQADTIIGENYTQSPAGSDSSGVIPAYDWALDQSGGYLDPQEYAIASAAGYTAHFGYQSRLFYDGSLRFYTNPSNPEFKTWSLQYYPELLNFQLNPQNKYGTGLFVDNSTGNPPGEGAGSVEGYDIVGNGYPELIESTDSYSNDYATLLNEIGLAIGPSNGWLMANPNGSLAIPATNNGQTYADPVVNKVQAYWQEEGIRLYEDYSQFMATLYNEVYYRYQNDSPSYTVLDTSTIDSSDSNELQAAEENPQNQLSALAAYYLVAPTHPNQGALDFFGGEQTSSNWVSPPPATYNHWSPAATYNVGTPVSPLPSTPAATYTPSSPNNEESDGSVYYVYDRLFTESNGQSVLVLYKPFSMLDGGPSKLTGSDSATTVTLPGSYYVLQADGTLSSTTVTSISLDNGEGAILVEEGTDGPAIASPATTAALIATIPSAAVSSTRSTSGLSARQSSAGPTTDALLATEFVDGFFSGLLLPNTAGASQSPPTQLTDPFAPWPNLDRLSSLWMVGKLLNTLGHSSQSDEPLRPADQALDALFSVSPIDDP